jgi:DNA replication and repair protein RecF
VFLHSLDLYAFRNHAGVKLAFENRLQLFVGPNARGKTNLVEAIYVLCTGRSFRRQAHTKDLIAFGQTEAAVRGTLEKDGLRSDLAVRLGGSSARRLFVNGNEIHLLRDYVRHGGVVAFQPDDLGMVRGGPDGRREFMDRAAFTLYPEYLDEYNRYTRALQARNQLLKHGAAPGELEAWSDELAATGAALAVRRERFLQGLLPEAMKTFQEIFGEVEAVLAYEPNPAVFKEHDTGDWEGVLRGELRARAADDAVRGFTTVGPHRDDLRIVVDGVDAKTHASQGQTRALALALRIAQIRHAKTVIGSSPLFILDDVGSELDAKRREFLAGFLHDSGVQAFITATEAGLLPTEGKEGQLWRLDEAGVHAA